MYCHFNWKAYLSKCNWPVCLLFLFCSLGLLLGAVFASRCSDFLASMMLRLPSAPLSIVGAACVWVLPLLISLIATFVNKRLLYAVAFFKSFGFAVCLCLITSAYGHYGWLMRSFLLFSDVCAYPVFCRFWYRCIRSEGNRGVLLSTAAILLCISAIDYMYISPFVMGL